MTLNSLMLIVSKFLGNGVEAFKDDLWHVLQKYPKSSQPERQ